MNNSENEQVENISNDLSNSPCEIDNHQYYQRIINYLQAKDLNGEEKIAERNWIKIQSANYHVIGVIND